MIQIRIDPDAPGTGLCHFCWQRVDTPQMVPTVIYEHGRHYRGAVACDYCLRLDETSLRREMLALAARAAEVVADAEAGEVVAELREAATGGIRRPRPEVLELERIYRLD